MADTAITRVPSGHDVSYRQTIMPSYSSGTFVGDDTDQHAFKVDGRGKGNLTYSVDNPTNQTVTITLYGMPSATAEVGDTGVCLITNGDFTATTATTAYKTNTTAFPYYLIRAKFAIAADSKTVTVFANFSAF